ncbi:hypothetical protein KFK09_014095 [Dendrobium nobile]|uniref:Uncharacterized protein n=1 Tax=Dendrobium nobile TaxID=94219 RepID=A0A8T3BAR4_DENNO|nr:hypothetical protein KFK09_014095 [Dendrobium nobile]
MNREACCFGGFGGLRLCESCVRKAETNAFVCLLILNTLENDDRRSAKNLREATRVQRPQRDFMRDLQIFAIFVSLYRGSCLICFFVNGLCFCWFGSLETRIGVWLLIAKAVDF